MMGVHRDGISVVLALVSIAACDGSRSDGSSDSASGTSPGDAGDQTLVVFNAGSLARPFRAALDTFAAHEAARGARIRIAQENAGSLETARKLTELGHIPDVIALADYEVFPQLLMPEYATWYVQFARNRVVLAYTDRSRGAAEVNTENWWRVVQRQGVETVYGDPNLDPAGYRALLAMQLAEQHYRQPGLAEGLRRAVASRNVRPKSADLVALLQAGELDYAWVYESMARSARLPYIRLPHEIDLSAPAESARYARASVRVTGATPRDTLTLRGEPIVYALSIPARAPHPALAERFVAFLLSPEGLRVLRAEQLDALDQPLVAGTGAPAAVRAAAGT